MPSPSKYTTISIRGKFAEPSLWHREGKELQLGCPQCHEREVCGGLSVDAPLHSCLDLCCGDPVACKRCACPNNVRKYIKLVNEVGGLELQPYAGTVTPVLAMPNYIPCVLDAGTLAGPLHIPVVAVSLYDIIDLRTGLAKFSTRQQLLGALRLYDDAKIVILSSAEDARVEKYWNVRRPKATAESLKRLRPALITTPNFSMHADTPRHDNLVSMSRIAECFQDFAAAGLPTALHVNGRTPHDFDRWTAYLIASPAISVLAYEMGTMGRSASRREWHAGQLERLAYNVKRPLTLVVRGGRDHLSRLAGAFERVVWTDTSALMKAKYRQSGRLSNARLSWIPSPTLAGEPIDNLFLHNIRVCQRMARQLLPNRTPPWLPRLRRRATVRDQHSLF